MNLAKNLLLNGIQILRFVSTVRVINKFIMNKKFIIYFTLILLAINTACSGGEDDPTGTETPKLEAPAFVSSNPTNGATNIPDGNLTVTFSYDQNITAPSASHNLITIDKGATVASVSAYMKDLTIKISGLEKETTYTLKVGKGVVLGPTKLEAKEVALSFTTVNKPEEPNITNKLCTANPMAQTQKLYDYLVSIYGKKILSGTIANVNWNMGEAELVYKATGKYPAMHTFDYIHLQWSPANWIDYSNTKVAEDWYNAGGIVSACWHWNVPAKENSTDYTCTPGNGSQNNDGNWTTTFRPKNIFVEGSWEKKIADADLEKIAGYLKLLQDKGIPIIWRPLHEAAGNTYEYQNGTAWFWWGYDGGETYVKLWKYMFDFFKSKGINNLIWVWTAQEKDADFYPGDAYVDIIGRDLYGASYNNEKNATQNAKHFKDVQQTYPNKMITLSECGSVGKISEQWEAGGKWSWFMPWYHYNATSLVGHQHADEAWWKDAMSQSFVLDREAVKEALK